MFAQCAPIALDSLGFGFFYFFFAWNLIAAVCYFFFFPETRNRTLEQMDELFGDNDVLEARKDAHVILTGPTEDLDEKA